MHSVHERAPRADVLIVSDGSRDSTATTARKTGAGVLDLRINLGMDGVVCASFIYAVGSGYRSAVQVDADG